jgi:hypothetical protein
VDNDGRRIIQNKDNGTSGETDGDYAYTNFYLLSSDPVPQDVYVYGEFTDWKMKPEYKMEYNKNRGRYDLETVLKQGRYEYFYVTDDNGKPSELTFEGSSSQTENEYFILVYHKNVKYKYDELIGVRKLTTTM